MIGAHGSRYESSPLHDFGFEDRPPWICSSHVTDAHPLNSCIGADFAEGPTWYVSSVTGGVTDQQGAAVPGVMVTIINTQTSENKVYVTDASGQHVAQDLNPGRYTVAFERQGLSRVERSDISVLLGRSFELNAEMRVGQLTETVTNLQCRSARAAGAR